MNSFVYKVLYLMGCIALNCVVLNWIDSTELCCVELHCMHCIVLLLFEWYLSCCVLL